MNKQKVCNVALCAAISMDYGEELSSIVSLYFPIYIHIVFSSISLSSLNFLYAPTSTISTNGVHRYYVNV